MSTPTFWLSFHAPYACRHRGACCASGWDIDIENARIPAIRAALASGPLAAPAQWYRTVAGAPDDVAGVLAHAPDGRCVFHCNPGCGIQRALGHAAMPAACQHFPRIALIDRRGVHVTLSHYCPTAAGLLFEGGPGATVVEGEPVLPDGSPPEGLDARDALPPLDTPRRLMDWESYSAWERRAVDVLVSTHPAEEALAQLDGRDADIDEGVLVELARRAVPPPYEWPPAPPPTWSPALDPAVVGRYLAAHAFASWMAYQGNGLRCTVLYLRLVLAVLRSECARGHTLLEAIRQADLLLRHLADREVVGERLSDMVMSRRGDVAM